MESIVLGVVCLLAVGGISILGYWVWRTMPGISVIATAANLAVISGEYKVYKIIMEAAKAANELQKTRLDIQKLSLEITRLQAERDLRKNQLEAQRLTLEVARLEEEKKEKEALVVEASWENVKEFAIRSPITPLGPIVGIIAMSGLAIGASLFYLNRPVPTAVSSPPLDEDIWAWRSGAMAGYPVNESPNASESPNSAAANGTSPSWLYFCRFGPEERGILTIRSDGRIKYDLFWANGVKPPDQLIAELQLGNGSTTSQIIQLDDLAFGKPNMEAGQGGMRPIEYRGQISNLGVKRLPDGIIIQTRKGEALVRCAPIAPIARERPVD